MNGRLVLVGFFGAAFVLAVIFVGPEAAGLIRDAAGGFVDLITP